MGLFPTVFLGHGSPMLAIEPNHWTQAWADLAQRLPRPQAVVVVSAHWLTRGTQVTAMAQPRTIHDFGGFPEELHRIQYPAPGAPALARKLALALGAGLDHEIWGLDHGAWAVLRYLYPEADVPVIQLSLDWDLSIHEHHRLAQQLLWLRQEGVLLLGSGNVVHNLALTRRQDGAAYDWAESFDRYVGEHMLSLNHQQVLDAPEQHSAGALAVPTPEHYWPLVYVLALAQSGEAVQVFNQDIALASISMSAFVIQH